MEPFRLPPGTHIAHVHLQVSRLEESLRFYARTLGFREVRREGTTVILSATGAPPWHILLTERPGVRSLPGPVTGLYHAAIRVPDRHELARIGRRLLDLRWPIRGASDHGVSEALYLTDPDGNGVEISADRPRETWIRGHGEVQMPSGELDLDDLLRELGPEEPKWVGIHPGADIGHVHLRVSDLGRSETFYRDVLGFAVTRRSHPGALFLAAGGYHHHLGLNVWAGRGIPPPPPDAAGLESFAVSIPGEGPWRALRDRLRGAGAALSLLPEPDWAMTMRTHDPDDNRIDLLVVPSRQPSGGSSC